MGRKNQILPFKKKKIGNKNGRNVDTKMDLNDC